MSNPSKLSASLLRLTLIFRFSEDCLGNEFPSPHLEHRAVTRIRCSRNHPLRDKGIQQRRSDILIPGTDCYSLCIHRVRHLSRFTVHKSSAVCQRSGEYTALPIVSWATDWGLCQVNTQSGAFTGKNQLDE